MRVHADPTRLEQVITNLLTNAAKYTDPGGKILVRAYAEPDSITIRVKDTGIGLAPEMLIGAFELFAQAEKSLDRARGGLGIGLSIVKKLVEMHGGKVWAESEGPGRGSEFVVRLPAFIDSEIAEDPPSPDLTAVAPMPKRVLVVDDSVDTAVGMMKLLRTAGHEVEIAHDGPAALERARKFRPHVILLDIGLPGLSGYEVAAQLRNDEHGQRIVLIAASGYGQQQDRERALAAGFDHHLAKPIDFDSLVALISPPG